MSEVTSRLPLTGPNPMSSNTSDAGPGAACEVVKLIGWDKSVILALRSARVAAS